MSMNGRDFVLKKETAREILSESSAKHCLEQ